MTVNQAAHFHKILVEIQKALEAEADTYINHGLTDSFRELLYELMLQALHTAKTERVTLQLSFLYICTLFQEFQNINSKVNFIIRIVI